MRQMKSICAKTVLILILMGTIYRESQANEKILHYLWIHIQSETYYPVDANTFPKLDAVKTILH